MAGGPTVNLVIAFVLFAVVFAAYGNRPSHDRRHGLRSSTAVPGLRDPEPADRACTAGDPVAPAAQAGLQPGDRIVVLQRHADHATGTQLQRR